MFKKIGIGLLPLIMSTQASAVLSIDIEVQEKKVPVVFYNGNGNSSYNTAMFNKIQTNIFKTKKADIISAGNKSCADVSKIKKTSVYCVNLTTSNNSYPDNVTQVNIQSIGFSGQNTYSKNIYFNNSTDNFHEASNDISDFVYQTLFNQNSYFKSKLAFVKSINNGNGWVYNLSVSNIDGSNEKTYLSSKAPIMSIDWSPNNDKLAYVSYEKVRPAIYIHNIKTGARKQITNFKGINSSPSWNPNGRSLVMSLSKDGTSDLYIYELSTSKLFKITHDNNADEAEPVWLNSEEIVYTSNRGGIPSLYKFNIVNKKTTKLQNTYRYVTTPKSSKDGMFTVAMFKNGKNYGLLKINENGKANVITTDFYGESPTVSSNNKLIIYSTKVGRLNVLKAIDLEGNELYKITSDKANIKEPALSN